MAFVAYFVKKCYFEYRIRILCIFLYMGTYFKSIFDICPSSSSVPSLSSSVRRPSAVRPTRRPSRRPSHRHRRRSSRRPYRRPSRRRRPYSVHPSRRPSRRPSVVVVVRPSSVYIYIYIYICINKK